jgi:hypothetical protein
MGLPGIDLSPTHQASIFYIQEDESADTILREVRVTANVELITLFQNLRCKHRSNTCLELITTDTNMAMSLLDGLKIVAYVINILCDRQTTIACELLFAGIFLCQPVQNLLCRFVRWENRIPHFDNFAFNNGKSNSLRKLPALPINRRQTQSLDKVQVFITE